MSNLPKPVIFLAFANDQDDRVGYLRNLPEEARQIREPLQRARADGLCEVVELANASADDIFRVFQSKEYRDRIAIFHYAGHANGYELLLESSEQKTVSADAAEFANFLGEQQGLQLVFLNGCSTQQQVQGLLNANVASVIATSRAIDDQAAMQFATRFYLGLAGGSGLQRAFKEAEAAVATKRGGQTRGAYFGDKQQENIETDRWPWDYYVREGAETVADWSLPEAAGDPLFGLAELPAQDLPDCPYRHLQWFGAEHAELFFGRGHQIRELYDLVTAEDAPRIILLYGQSGVGKSSILAAGLIPRLGESFEVIYVRRDQRVGLRKTLKNALAYGGPDASEMSVHFAADWLNIERQIGKPLIVIVDQVEECYSRPNPAHPQELDDFLNEIHEIFGSLHTRPMGRLILGFRKEWLAEIERRIQERRLPRAKVFLERLGRRGIVEAVLGPTSTDRLQQQYRLHIEDYLAEMIADDLLGDRESAIAPTLQILLTTMWHQAAEENESRPHFDRELYRSLKTQGILLQDFLDQQLEQLGTWQEDVIESGLALDLLACHTTAFGTADVRSEHELPNIYKHRQDVLDDLVQRCKDLYLLVDLARDSRSASSGTRLSHDTLAPLVRARFEDSDRPGQRARRIINTRMDDWSGEERGAPLNARDLEIVEQGIRGSRALSSLEQELLEYSREEHEKNIRSRRQFRIAGIVALAIVLLLGAINVIQYVARQQQMEAALDIAHESVDGFYTSIAANELLNQPGMTELRRELLLKGKDFYEDFVAKVGDTSEAQEKVAVASYNLGRVYAEQGGDDLQKAFDNFEIAKQIQQEIYGPTPQDNDHRLHLSNTLTEVGNVSFDLGNFDVAQDNYDAARNLRQLLANADEANDEYQMRLADAVMNCGKVREALGEVLDATGKSVEANERYEEAKTFYTTAQGMRQSVLDEITESGDRETVAVKPKIDDVRRQIGFGDHNLKGFYELTEDFAQVKTHCDQAITNFNLVSQSQPMDGEVATTRADCRISLANLDVVSDEVGDREMKMALEELGLFVRYYPAANFYKRKYANGLIEMSRYHMDSKYLAEAEEILKQVMADSPADADAAQLQADVNETRKTLLEQPED